jgi:hypothetical protein
MEVRMSYYLTRTVRRVASTVAALGALSGCADPISPARTVAPQRIIIIGGHPIVFNAQLRAIGNPDIKPAIAVYGHLQLKLDETADGLVLGFRASIVNPECESSSSFGGGIYAIQDSEDFPSPEDVAMVYLLSPEDPLGCEERILVGVVGVSEEVASRMVGNPNEFTAVFFLSGGGALAGSLQLGGPDTSPSP